MLCVGIILAIAMATPLSPASDRLVPQKRDAPWSHGSSSSGSSMHVSPAKEYSSPGAFARIARGGCDCCGDVSMSPHYAEDETEQSVIKLDDTVVQLQPEVLPEAEQTEGKRSVGLGEMQGWRCG